MTNFDLFLFQLINEGMRNLVFDNVMQLISRYDYNTWLVVIIFIGVLNKRSGISNAHFFLTSQPRDRFLQTRS